ncbi:MAG TPA: ATP-binding protein [Syntrophobacter fumaroxidans]|nr:ATP-binding protein [Syntrophobacter fumaroxidans]
MQRNYTWRTRVLLSFWMVLLLALLLPPWYYFRILTRETMDETTKAAIQQLGLARWFLDREKEIGTVEDLQDRIVEIGGQLGLRLTYVAEGGRVIADSVVPRADIPNMDNHAGRPEIIEARDREVAVVTRFSRTTQTELLHVARTVEGRGTIPPGVLRLATPLSKIREPLDRLKDSLLLFLALVSIATAGLSYFLVRRLNEPLRAMIHTAEAIATKDYRTRIHSSPGQEFYPLTQSINRMAESIENHVRTITEQKQQLEAVFDAMQEGVMVLDTQGKIRTTNRSFSGLVPGDSAVAGRRPLEVIVNVELQESCDRIMASTSDSEGAPFSLQITLGQERTYDVNIVGIADSQTGAGAVVVFHDISELKRLEKVRQDFVANVSHELRTPLTSIKGYTETLLAEDRVDPHMLSSFLQIVLKNTNHVVKIVEDLLQLARLEAQQKPPNAVPVNAANALTAAWKACAHQAESKRVRLESTLPEGGVWVCADFDQLVQVFRNLLENAIRYSPEGEAVTVSHEARREKVTLMVRDEGPGIPGAHQQRIFERFYRVEKHRSDNWGSTGLGLAICRHILRNFGGRIRVQSPNTGGTTGTAFLFTLPAVPLGAGEPGTQNDPAVTT